MKNSACLRNQKKCFRNIIKAMAKTRFAEATGLSSLSQDDKFTELFAKYTEIIDITTHEQLIMLLRKINNNHDSNDIDLINTPNLLSSKTFEKFGHTRRGFVRPLDLDLLKQLDIIDDFIRYTIRKNNLKTIKNGRTFYALDQAAIKHYNGIDIADLRTLQISNNGLFKSKKYPNLKSMIPAGQSHHQCLHAMLDELERYGDKVTTLVASAKQIVEMGLLYSQRRGEFATFKNLLPNLKLWVNDTGFYSVNQKLIESIFIGLNVKKVDIYNSITGALALQEDIKKPGVLTLQTDMDVFYEFVPVEYVNFKGRALQSATRLHAGSVELNKDYVLAVSNKAGLLSISTSDVVRVVNKKPLQIIYMRRAQTLNHAKEMLNTHTINNIIASLNNVLAGYHIVIRDYLVGYDSMEKRHIWAIELNKSPEMIDEKVLASVTNRIHKMLMQQSRLYHRAVEESNLNAPRMFMLPLGGLSIFEKPKGVYCLDLTENASLVQKYINSNNSKLFQASNFKVV